MFAISCNGVWTTAGYVTMSWIHALCSAEDECLNELFESISNTISEIVAVVDTGIWTPSFSACNATSVTVAVALQAYATRVDGMNIKLARDMHADISTSSDANLFLFLEGATGVRRAMHRWTRLRQLLQRQRHPAMVLSRIPERSLKCTEFSWLFSPHLNKVSKHLPISRR